MKGANVRWIRCIWVILCTRWKYQLPAMTASAWKTSCWQAGHTASSPISAPTNFFSSSGFSRNSRMSSWLGASNWSERPVGTDWFEGWWSWPLVGILSWHSSALGWPNTNKLGMTNRVSQCTLQIQIQIHMQMQIQIQIQIQKQIRTNWADTAVHWDDQQG